MRRIAVLAAVLILWQGVQVVANPLSLLMPSASDVIKLLDKLTKSDSATSVDVKLGKTVTQGKLLVARARIDVAMERTSRNWRGKVHVQVKVPTDVSYSIDLSSIKAEDIRLDPTKRALVVKMPPPVVEDVTPVLSKVNHESDYGAARFRFLDTDTSRELQNAMLLHDYQGRARTAGEKATSKVRRQGRAALEEFLRTMLAGAAPGVEIIVE